MTSKLFIKVIFLYLKQMSKNLDQHQSAAMFVYLYRRLNKIKQGKLNIN